ncbi:MAG: prepilin-type N-terminal cleavage/methylation domain-containing protein, partial [Planctomycetota bacterium]
MPSVVRGFRGFTIIELLIVVVIIGILVGAIVTASTVFISDARIKNTKTVLLVLRDALEQFKEDKPPITNIIQGDTASPQTPTYLKRYGLYPPDELDVYGKKGLPGSVGNYGYPLVGRNKGEIHPTINTKEAQQARMRFYTNSDPDHDALEHRDIAAMMLTLDLYSESASSMLSRIPTRNWSPGAVDKKGNPIQFLD